MSAPIARPSTRWSGSTRALALETATRGVTVNAVCPGYTDTDLVREQHRARRRQDRPRAIGCARPNTTETAPIGRLIQPEEVAAAVLYLCSAEAAAVTGTTLAIAGGI